MSSLPSLAKSGKLTLPDGHELALVIRTEGAPESTSRYDYWHCLAEPALIDRIAGSSDCDLGRVRFGHAVGALENLQVYSQGNADDTPRKLYGFDVLYRDSGHIGLDRAYEMAAVLGRINRALERERERDGHPATYGHYVARVARALGVKWILFPPPDGKPDWGNEYYWDRSRIGDAIGRIDSLVWRWQHAVKTEENAPA
jgi:hypothetical protein